MKKNKNHTSLPKDLDPKDWEEFRRLAHQTTDQLVDYMASVRKRPVWKKVPDDVMEAFKQPLPGKGLGAEGAAKICQEMLLPYTVGNAHPKFMGWVHGGGTAGGLIEAMYEAVINANVGGRDHGAIYIEKQVIAWAIEMFGFPKGSSGILTTGTSMANLISLTAARHAKTDWDVRNEGMAPGGGILRVYAPETIHGSVDKSLDLLGFGQNALVRVPARADRTADVPALKSAIDEDRKKGLKPMAIVATVGTVDTGAIDDLSSMSNLAREELLWFHVDGAFGALAILSPDLAPLLKGIEGADSLAFDFHKWGQVTYDCGCVLIRDANIHFEAFTKDQNYLADAGRGLAAGKPWFCDYGPELSRGFRALKAWFLLMEHGTEALGRIISYTSQLAKVIEDRVREEEALELLSPASLNIVCFRVAPKGEEDGDSLNREIVADLQEKGLAVPSTTIVDGKLAIRCCICNHRTREEDVMGVIDDILVVASERRR